MGSPPRLELRVDGGLPPRGVGVEIARDWRGASEAFWVMKESLGIPWGSACRRVGRLPVGARVTVDDELVHVEGAMERLRIQDVAPGVADPSGAPVGEFCRECGADRGEACHSRCPLRGDPPPVSGSEVCGSDPGAPGGARAHGASSGRDERVWRLDVDENGKRWIALSGSGWPGEHGLTRGEIDETMELVSAAELERVRVAGRYLAAATRFALPRVEGPGCDPFYADVACALRRWDAVTGVPS